MFQVATCVGELVVPLPPADALDLFTPEIERKWQVGYEPEYVSSRTEGMGAAFLTGESVWVLVVHDERSVRYARFVPGMHVSVIDVTVLAAGSDGTRLKVVFDLSPLSSDGEAGARAVEARFPEMVVNWQRLLDGFLARRA